MRIVQTWIDPAGNPCEHSIELPDVLSFALSEAPADPTANALLLAQAYGATAITGASPADSIANQQTIAGQVDAALASNATYLAIASPNNLQLIAQVRSLTRQANGLIRLLRKKLDATS